MQSMQQISARLRQQQQTAYAVRSAADERAWLALGLIVRPGVEPADFSLFGATRDTSDTIGWRYVITPEHLLSFPAASENASFMTVPCMDGQSTMQLSCWCKSVWFFSKGLAIFTNAQFLGKLEDDVTVHAARLLLELQWASAQLSQTKSKLIWMSKFLWSIAADTGQYLHGSICYLPAGTDHASLQGFQPHCGLKPREESSNASNRHSRSGLPAKTWLAPFAVGGADIKSRALAEQLIGCRDLWTEGWGLACDWATGYWTLRCAAEEHTIHAFHLPSAYKWVGFRSGSVHWKLPFQSLQHPYTEHVTIMHGLKRRDTAARKWPCQQCLLQRAHENASRAMLPIHMLLHRVDGAAGSVMQWKPANQTLARRFVKLDRRWRGAGGGVHHGNRWAFSQDVCEKLPCA